VEVISMRDSHAYFPLAYLISFRPYGTWLHGDERGSVDRHRNRYRSPRIVKSEAWLRTNAAAMTHPPVALDARRRSAVSAAVRETCDIRGWQLRALNVRTNHVHVVVSAACAPESVISALKANATRQMREADCWPYAYSPWAKGGSKRYLWNEASVLRAVAYVVDAQGDPLPEE
jgi:REP element-mobilizing transposase RayT